MRSDIRGTAGKRHTAGRQLESGIVEQTSIRVAVDTRCGACGGTIERGAAAIEKGVAGYFPNLVVHDVCPRSAVGEQREE